jgi:epoxyqueuosine reductase
MSYLGRSARKRRDLRVLDPNARSVVVTATVYNTDRPYSNEQRDPLRAVVARYAWGDDYHVIVRQRLDALLDWMRETNPEPFESRIYVDTGPIQERVFAQYAGLGWIGKNSCLIDPELGSWVFLGCLICSLPLEPDTPGLDQCGDCTACLTACPTGALVGPRVLDATRCISYLTIEQGREIPETLRPAMRNIVYGCDICQDVCPWNRGVEKRRAGEPPPAGAEANVSLVEWLESDPDELARRYERLFVPRKDGRFLKRNALVALGNNGRPEQRELAERFLTDDDPMLSEYAEWAGARLDERAGAA